MITERERSVRVGEVRPSQLMFAFGIGSVVDLPHFSVVVMGLDDWPQTDVRTLVDERLLDAVRNELGAQVTELRSPPYAQAPQVGIRMPFDQSLQVGVPVGTFPRWFVCPECHRLTTLNSGLITAKPDHFRPDRVHYEHDNCPHGRGRKPTAIPARFIVACEHGHMDDFPWLDFVHGGATTCHASLKLTESGATGEASAIYVRCDTCDKSRPMSDAFSDDGQQWATPCTGRRIHLRDYEECDEQAKPVLLGASNTWFPISISALSIPEYRDPLPQLVADHWHILSRAESASSISLLRDLGNLPAFMGYTEDEIWTAVRNHQDVTEEEEGVELENLRVREWETFTHPGSQPDSRDFRLRRVPSPPGYEDMIEQVVLAERLREVEALIGFTRLSSPGDFTEYSAVPPERRVPLSRDEPTWVPAAEVRGEGIFIQFSEEAMQRWVGTIPAIIRASEFTDAHARWCRMRQVDPAQVKFPGMRYILLHTFAHALMRQLSLECGYTGSSVRERLYSAEGRDAGGPMAGVLIYTAAPDSEGTLGGLVSLGEPEELSYHIGQALETAMFCPSDPLCAEHRPLDGGMSVHAAACHSCLFIPETSCERGNRYLDRATLAPTFADTDVSFFRHGQ